MSHPVFNYCSSYPHIVDMILNHLNANRKALFALRLLSKSIREAVDHRTVIRVVVKHIHKSKEFMSKDSTSVDLSPKPNSGNTAGHSNGGSERAVDKEPTLITPAGRVPVFCPAFFNPQLKSGAITTDPRYVTLFQHVRQVEFVGPCPPEYMQHLCPLLTNVWVVRLGNSRYFRAFSPMTEMVDLTSPAECTVPAQTIVLCMKRGSNPWDTWPSFPAPVANKVNKLVLHILHEIDTGNNNVRPAKPKPPAKLSYRHFPNLQHVVLVFYQGRIPHYSLLGYLQVQPNDYSISGPLGPVLSTIAHNVSRAKYTLLGLETLQIEHNKTSVPSHDIVETVKNIIATDIRRIHPDKTEGEVEGLMSKVEFMTRKEYRTREGDDQF